MNETLDLVMSYVAPVFGAVMIVTLMTGGLFIAGAFWVLLFKALKGRIQNGNWS